MTDESKDNGWNACAYLIVDDIYETGQTLKIANSYLRSMLRAKPGKWSVENAVLVNKRGFDRFKVDLHYIGFEYSEGKWLYGYGMDDNGAKRYLPDIYFKSIS